LITLPHYDINDQQMTRIAVVRRTRKILDAGAPFRGIELIGWRTKT
jgi:hypothetical protein